MGSGMPRQPFNDLAAFAAVARARSFTAAAAELGLSPSALSHAMRGLEERLGVRLLARSTRSVAASEAGAALLARLRPALGQIEEGLSALSDWRDGPAGTVRLTTFHWIASSLLSDRLPDLLRRHPDITVEVHVDDGLTDVVAYWFDAGIRLGEAVQKDRSRSASARHCAPSSSCGRTTGSGMADRSIRTICAAIAASATACRRADGCCRGISRRTDASCGCP